MAYKVFTNGSVLNASEINENLMRQSVISFSNAAARTAAITSPTEGMITYLEDSGSYQSFDGTTWIGLVPQSANAIINGAFDIWQRGASFVNPANGAFGADRFYVVHDGSGQRTVSRENFTPGSAPVAGYESQFFYRYNQTVAGSGQTFGSIVHRIEDARTFAGQTVTFSFWAKADATRSVTLFWSQFFGSGGSSIVDTNFGTISLTTSWVRYSVTATLPSVTGKTIGTGSALQLQIALPINTTQTIDIWGLQLEAGSVATPFRRNATSLQGELAACQRYYFRNTPGETFGPIGQGYVDSSTNIVIWIDPPVQMRTKPSSVEFSGLNAADFSNVTSALSAISLASGFGIGPNRVGLNCTTTGATAGRGASLRCNNNANGFLGLSAEL
jgi:hypothetical protein